jgi:hypothetical protein
VVLDCYIGTGFPGMDATVLIRTFDVGEEADLYPRDFGRAFEGWTLADGVASP